MSIPFTTTLSTLSAYTARANLSALQATQWFKEQAREHYDDDAGMSTVEYALGTVAAAALGALLYTVVTSDAVEQALTGIFERALNEGK